MTILYAENLCENNNLQNKIIIYSASKSVKICDKELNI